MNSRTYRLGSITARPQTFLQRGPRGSMDEKRTAPTGAVLTNEVCSSPLGFRLGLDPGHRFAQLFFALVVE